MTSIRRALVLGVFALAAGLAGTVPAQAMAPPKPKHPFGLLLSLGSPSLATASVTPAVGGPGGTPPEDTPPASPKSPKGPQGPILGP